MRSKKYNSINAARAPRRSFLFSKFGIVIIFVLLLICIATAMLGVGPPYPIFSTLFDTANPYIIGAAPESGAIITLQERALPFEIGDDGTGIRNVSVICGDHSLFNQSNSSGVKRTKIDQIDIEKLPEGKITCRIIANDWSWFGYELVVDFSLMIDHSPPTVSVMSLQPFATAGGVEFIVYQAKDSAGIVATGARTKKSAGVESTSALGIKLSEFDPQHTYPNDLYAALLPLRHDLNEGPIAVEVFVRDVGGNERIALTEFPVRAIKRPRVKPQLSENFLSTRVPPLFEEFKKLSGYSAATPSPSEQFRLVNEDYRKLLALKIRGIFADASPERKWSTLFGRPVAGSTTSVFGEEREYFFKDVSAGFSLHEGLDLASVKQDRVVAVAPGKVVFANSLGIYGEAIIIDHGGEVMSLYGHLSSFNINLGDQVTQGQVIAMSGATGLAGGDHLHFEIRVNGVSVSPLEWWDSKWFKDNIELKLAQVRSS